MNPKYLEAEMGCLRILAAQAETEEDNEATWTGSKSDG